MAMYGQDTTAPPKLDLFAPVVPEGRWHLSFKILTETRGHSSTREIIGEMMPQLEDADGNFVEQFQSTGFDARLGDP